MFKSVAVRSMLVAVFTDTGSTNGRLANDFANMIEAKIRREIPTWGTERVLASGKVGKELKQPGSKSKVSGATITLTNGIKRTIPSSISGQLVRIDEGYAEFEARGIVLATPLPGDDSYLGERLAEMAKEFLAKNTSAETPKPEVPAPAQA